jgi:hypothetical protein
MKKIKYEKPTSLDAGQVAAVQGANCSNGTAPVAGECINGSDPAIIPYCPAGNIATGNCYTAGHTAGQSCFVGAHPGW